MGDSNQITVSTELGDVVVRKMALNDYAELLRALDKLPQKVGEIVGDKNLDFKKMETTEFLAFLPAVLADSWSDFVALIAVPTDKDAEWLGRLDGADAVDVVVAIFELNDFARIVSAVKKLAALKSKMAPAAPAAPAPQE